MKKCTDFLSSLHQKGVRLWLDDDHIRYRASKGTLTAKEIATLQTMRDEIVDVLKQRKAVAVESSALMQRGSAILAPLTIQQESIWQGLQRGGLSYLHPSALRISGPLSVELLRRSFEVIIRRHDSLRTRIVVVDGVPMQKIDNPYEYQLKVVNLTGVLEIETSARVQGVIEEVTNQGCDPAVGPLFDARLIKLAEHKYFLIWSIHHIVSDGSSSSLIFQEFWLAYSEFLRGQPSPLQAPAMQYADYAVWQQKTQRSWLEEHESYWKERLAEAEGIKWPVNGYAPGMKSDACEEAHIQFGRALSSRLREVAPSTGTTLGMTVLTVYVAVVSRWCNQKDFIVATAVTGRDRSELESITGFCAHDLYLRIRLTGEETFMGLLTQVGQEFQSAVLHQDFGRAVVHTPDFARTLFQWWPWQADDHDGVPKSGVAKNLDITIERYPIEITLKKAGPFPQYDMMTIFSDTEEGIVGRVGCVASVFTANAIEHFVQDLRSTAEQLVKNPYARVATVIGG